MRRRRRVRRQKAALSLALGIFWLTAVAATALLWVRRYGS